MDQLYDQEAFSPEESLKEFGEAITEPKTEYCDILVEIKRFRFFDAKPKIKEIEENIAKEKAAFVAKSKDLKKKGDFLKRKMADIDMQIKIDTIVAFSQSFEKILAGSSLTKKHTSFFAEFIPEENDRELLELFEHVEFNLENTSYGSFKKNLFLLWKEKLQSSSQAALDVVFANMIEQQHNRLALVNDLSRSANYLLSEILKAIVSTLIKYQMEQNYTTLKKLEKLSQNLFKEKQRKGIVKLTFENTFKLTSQVDLLVFPYKNILMLAFLSLALFFEMNKYYPICGDRRTFLKFLQHDARALYLIAVI